MTRRPIFSAVSRLAQIPVIPPATFATIIDLRAAKSRGIRILGRLVRANEVIAHMAARMSAFDTTSPIKPGPTNGRFPTHLLVRFGDIGRAAR